MARSRAPGFMGPGVPSLYVGTQSPPAPRQPHENGRPQRARVLLKVDGMKKKSVRQSTPMDPEQARARAKKLRELLADVKGGLKAEAWAGIGW